MQLMAQEGVAAKWDTLCAAATIFNMEILVFTTICTSGGSDVPGPYRVLPLWSSPTERKLCLVYHSKGEQFNSTLPHPECALDDVAIQPLSNAWGLLAVDPPTTPKSPLHLWTESVNNLVSSLYLSLPHSLSSLSLIVNLGLKSFRQAGFSGNWSALTKMRGYGLTTLIQGDTITFNRGESPTVTTRRWLTSFKAHLKSEGKNKCSFKHPDGEVCTGELSADGAHILWSDNELWVRTDFVKV